MSAADGWRCPVCGGHDGAPMWSAPRRRRPDASAGQFRPASDSYGETLAPVLRCRCCGHGSLAVPPSLEDLRTRYAAVADITTGREQAGQVATARRALEWIETVAAPGRLADLGCWTGSFLVAAADRGWAGVGVETSAWAVDRARERGVDARLADLHDPGLEPGAYRAVVMADVMEHVPDPRRVADVVAGLLEPGGVFWVAVPDAGSRPARALGRHWWSVLPAHVQFFTAASMRRLLEAAGLHPVGVRTHPKSFSVRYYSGRLSGYSPAAARTATRLTGSLGLSDRLVAPDLHDRMQVLAVRPR